MSPSVAGPAAAGNWRRLPGGAVSFPVSSAGVVGALMMCRSPAALSESSAVCWAACDGILGAGATSAVPVAATWVAAPLLVAAAELSGGAAAGAMAGAAAVVAFAAAATV